MPISGLVISLAKASTLQNDTLRQLENDPRIEIGQRFMGRLAIVAETDSRQEDKAVWSWLEEMPGVVHVDLAFASFDSPDSPHSQPPQSESGTTPLADAPPTDPQLAVARRDSNSSAPSQNLEGSSHGC